MLRGHPQHLSEVLGDQAYLAQRHAQPGLVLGRVEWVRLQGGDGDRGQVGGSGLGGDQAHTRRGVVEGSLRLGVLEVAPRRLLRCGVVLDTRIETGGFGNEEDLEQLVETPMLALEVNDFAQVRVHTIME